MKVLHVLRGDAGLYYGGGEVQAERTREALTKLGVETRVHEALNKDLGDIVHFFGLFDSHWDIAQHCISRKVPYVVSPIFVTPRTVGRLKWRSFRQRYIDFQFPKAQHKLLKNAKEIYPLTGFEERNIRTFFPDLSAPFIRIPNGVEDRFANGDPELFRREYGVQGDYVLHAATIEKTKNQLGLIRALKGTGKTLVLLGRIHNQEYWQQCQREMDSNMRHLGQIPHEGPLLPSAYAAATVFCLPSRREILPLSAMEATVAGCSLVLGSKWGGQEIWEGKARFVDPDDVAGIRNAVLAGYEQKQDPRIAVQFLKQYRWAAVGQLLKDRYIGVINTR